MSKIQRLSKLVLIFLFGFQTAQAVDLNNDMAKPGVLDVVTNIPDDMSLWWKETFSKENIPMLLGVLGTTTVGTMTDYETWQAVRRPYIESESFKKFSDYGEIIYNGNFQVAMTGGFLLLGTVTINHRALRTGEQILEALLSSGIVVQVIKHSTGRESPVSSTQRDGHWSVFPNQREYMKDYQSHDAMPSGHLSTAMAAFIVVQENYPEQAWIPWVGYPVMAWVCVGLVGSGIHWWSDFPIAAALGYHFAKIVTRNNYPHPELDKNSFFHPDILPSFADNGEPMVAARWRW